MNTKGKDSHNDSHWPHPPGTLAVDPRLGLAYLYLREGIYHTQKWLDVDNDIIGDYDKEGNLLGIEFLKWPTSVVPKLHVDEPKDVQYFSKVLKTRGKRPKAKTKIKIKIVK